LILIALTPHISSAQVKFYQHDTTVKVFAYGKQQTLAWCGGFNNPQFAMADLNRDGLQDLVVFEPWNSVRTFINEGTAGHPNYRYAPEFEPSFPPILDYMILADYDRDGINDLFQQGSYGFAVYKGYYNANNHLAFAFYQDLFLYNDGYVGGAENAFNNPGDIPSIVDVDGDSDLDFVAYNIVGGAMNLYKNLQTELGLPHDSIHIELADRCWGRVYQGFYRTHELPYVCDESHLRPGHAVGKTTHSGNTPCLFDWDMDGDYDYLDGSVSFNEMTFLKNGRIEKGSGPDSMIYQDTVWQSAPGGTPIELPIFPAAFNIDIDQDGKKDLVIAPNGSGLSVSKNYNNIYYYNNLTTPGAPNWQFQSDTFLCDMTIDLGSYSYPMYFDYNKDGKPDLFIGSDGYYQDGSGLMRSRISYYKNTSSPGLPSFTLQTSDFMGINSYDFKGTAPAFGDIDGDGKADFIIGHDDGTLSYFKNIAAYDTIQPNWQMTEQYLTDVDGDTINVGAYAAPFVYDIDKDGKKDLIIGSIYGTITYYQNVSTTPGTVMLKLVSNHLGNVKADPNLGFGNYSTPFIGKVDSTGTDYLMLGSNSGMIYKCTGFQSGDTTATYTIVDSTFSYIDTMYSQYRHSGTTYGIYSGLRSTLTIGDINNDGNFYMVVGNNKGGVENYKLKTYTPLPVVNHTNIGSDNEDGKVLIYPNPANDVLNISWMGVLQPSVSISIVNMEGQNLYTTTISTATDHTSVPVSMLPPGMYVCMVQSGVNRYYNKFTVVR